MWLPCLPCEAPAAVLSRVDAFFAAPVHVCACSGPPAAGSRFATQVTICARGRRLSCARASAASPPRFASTSAAPSALLVDNIVVAHIAKMALVSRAAGARHPLRPERVRCLTFARARADPFAQDKEKDNAANTKDYVHIRIQQRNGRKSLTTVQVS